MRVAPYSPSSDPKRPRHRGGFSLIEMVISATILAVLLVVVLEMTTQISSVWHRSTGRITAYQNARAAFDTLTRTLSQATLHTYLDYTDSAGQARDPSNPADFVPNRFTRVSELHFVSGPTNDLVAGASPVLNPGHSVFFTAPLGRSDDNDLQALDRTLNALGFYVRYGNVGGSGLLPDWMESRFGNGENRFQLLQFVHPAEDHGVYLSTSASGYDRNWFSNVFSASAPEIRGAVLAENVLALVLRPRLAPRDERAVATPLGTTYSDDTSGSLLCPNYAYDSRSWEDGYPAGASSVSGTNRIELMRNQLPPIVDVVLVCADPQSLQRFDFTGSTPPSELTVPAGLFTNAANLEADLETLTNQLIDAGVRFQVFQSAVQIKAAKWSNTIF